MNGLTRFCKECEPKFAEMIENNNKKAKMIWVIWALTSLVLICVVIALNNPFADPGEPLVFKEPNDSIVTKDQMIVEFRALEDMINEEGGIVDPEQIKKVSEITYKRNFPSLYAAYM